MKNEVIKINPKELDLEVKLSMCCGTDVHLTDTTNGIKCYCCVNCGKLTGVVNKLGNRVN